MSQIWKYFHVSVLQGFRIGSGGKMFFTTYPFFIFSIPLPLPLPPLSSPVPEKLLLTTKTNLFVCCMMRVCSANLLMAFCDRQDFTLSSIFNLHNNRLSHSLTSSHTHVTRTVTLTDSLTVQVELLGLEDDSVIMRLMDDYLMISTNRLVPAGFLFVLTS